MKDKKLEANLSMVASRVMAGLNMNGLKFLLPLWLGALTGVTVRCVFAAVAFWITSWFVKEAPVTRRQRIGLFCLGAFGLYGFMFCYLLGISKTTPVSSAIFNSMQPIWVFLISVFFLHEKATLMKVIGIALGFGGALLCILTQGSDDLAHDAFTGNMLCMVSSLVFAVYLIVSKKLLEEVGVVTMMKYIFGGAAVTGLIVSSIIGWDAPLLTDALHGEWHWVPWAVLAFVLDFFLVGKLAKRKAMQMVNPEKENPFHLVLAISVVSVLWMCPLMSLAATILFQHAGRQIIAVWLQTTALNFPMALCWQLFFAGPLVRFLFRQGMKCAVKLRKNA